LAASANTGFAANSLDGSAGPAEQPQRPRDIEELAIKADENPGSDADVVVKGMLPIRDLTAAQLRSRELFVATEIINHLLTTNPAASTRAF
jgi:hypothetical protein